MVVVDRFVDRAIDADSAIRAIGGTTSWYPVSAPGAPGRSSHNPPVVGSSPTRPTP